MGNTETALLRKKVKQADPARISAMLEHDAAGNSKYKAEYCAVVEHWGTEGKSRMEMASLLNLSRGTLSNWEAQYSDFAQAMARATAHAQAWWERKASESLDKKHFQAQLWRYSMAGRFKDDYAEQKQQNNGGFDLNVFVAGLPGQGAHVQVTATPQRQLADVARAVDVELEQPAEDIDLANLLD